MLKLGGSREVKISWLSPKFNDSLNHGISWTKGVFDVWSQQTEETEETEGYFTTFRQEQTSRFRVLDIGSMYGIFTYIYHHIYGTCKEIFHTWSTREGQNSFVTCFDSIFAFHAESKVFEDYSAARPGWLLFLVSIMKLLPVTLKRTILTHKKDTLTKGTSYMSRPAHPFWRICFAFWGVLDISTFNKTFEADWFSYDATWYSCIWYIYIYFFHKGSSQQEIFNQNNQ